jgi:hypothetical protein
VKSLSTLGLAAAALAGISACASSSSGPRTPDEFNVVRKAPLSVPPEFNLRPPTPGESRPQELDPEQQARVAIFGQDTGREASEGEKLFISAAGGDAVSRSVRSSIDFEAAQVVRKSSSLTDAILFFNRPGSPNEPVVDAAAEAERLRVEQEAVAEVTGGGEILIKRQRSGKLPGL